MTKPLGERVEKVEGIVVAHMESCSTHWASVDGHLEKLNNQVSKNSDFRLQQKTVYGVIAFAWISVLIPLTAIAVAVLA
ncbi:hypothetical protein LCGC14_1641820 [marine sediment metagenome]|uniref:Uncharacterized protein n=1 Tax=marine sediment metagenome TaxID=412755 RepID=A0A0F9ILV8_9ZZZZ